MNMVITYIATPTQCQSAAQPHPLRPIHLSVIASHSARLSTRRPHGSNTKFRHPAAQWMWQCRYAHLDFH